MTKVQSENRKKTIKERFFSEDFLKKNKLTAFNVHRNLKEYYDFNNYNRIHKLLKSDFKHMSKMETIVKEILNLPKSKINHSILMGMLEANFSLEQPLDSIATFLKDPMFKKEKGHFEEHNCHYYTRMLEFIDSKPQKTKHPHEIMPVKSNYVKEHDLDFSRMSWYGKGVK